jgi:transposase
MDSQFKEEFKLEMPEGRIRKRKKKKGSKAVFKAYDQHQMSMLPASLEEMIEENHIVRLVNTMIDELKLKSLIDTYKGGGTSSYNPVMLMKVWIYAIVMKVYTGRQLAKALRENIYFKWLSGNNTPDFRTLNDFRSGRLKGVIEEIFTETVVFLIGAGYIDLKKYFVDGTTIQANANKYTYVWKKNTDRYMEAVQQKVKELFKQIEDLNRQENKEYGNKDLEELGQRKLTSQEIKEQVKKLNKIIEQSDLGKAQKKKAESLLSKIEHKEVPKVEKYEDQKEKLQARNSYSKTENDATFMKMKNKLLLPSYGVLAGTENQYILNCSIHQSGNDGANFISHIEKYKRTLGKYPKHAVGDSIFGTEQNSEYLEKKRIKNYLKYSSFHKETTKKHKEDKFHKDNFKYNEQADSFECPNGKELKFKEVRKNINRSGYEQTVENYQCVDCSGCLYAKECKKGEAERTIQINRNLERHKKIMRKNLYSKKGIELRKQRSIDVETVFGDIKWNQNFTRFVLRGKEKVNVEMALICMAHNYKKAFLTIN